MGGILAQTLRTCQTKLKPPCQQCHPSSALGIPLPLNSIKEAPLHPERKSVRWSGATSDLGMKQVMP